MLSSHLHAPFSELRRVPPFFFRWCDAGSQAVIPIAKKANKNIMSKCVVLSSLRWVL